MKNQEIIINKLKNKNIKPSHIRISIYDYISKDRIHPTVDTIYKDLSKSLPTLSKTTIYNTLNLFVEKDLIKALNLNDNTMRYELVRSDHAHLKCRTCSEIFDIPAQVELELPKDLEDSTIDDIDILLLGTCPKCLKDKD